MLPAPASTVSSVHYEADSLVTVLVYSRTSNADDCTPRCVVLQYIIAPTQDTRRSRSQLALVACAWSSHKIVAPFQTGIHALINVIARNLGRPRVEGLRHFAFSSPRIADEGATNIVGQSVSDRVIRLTASMCYGAPTATGVRAVLVQPCLPEAPSERDFSSSRFIHSHPAGRNGK
jgi:hypothetical protein